MLHPKIRALVDLIADFDAIEVKSEPEALLLEGKLIKQWKPRYNTDFTDDKRFLLVRVDAREELPRFRLVRLRKDDRSRYFGPFAHSGQLRKALAQMRSKFGILLGDGTPRQLPDGSWQLLEPRATTRMIITQTPLRISFARGGSDLPSFYRRFGGAVVSTAIDKYVYINVNKKFDNGIRIAYSRTEEVSSVDEIDHRIVRTTLKKLGLTGGIEITSIADIPSSGTGLGFFKCFYRRSVIGPPCVSIAIYFGR